MTLLVTEPQKIILTHFCLCGRVVAISLILSALPTRMLGNLIALSKSLVYLLVYDHDGNITQKAFFHFCVVE